tara:strand:- start:201 stop:863 length:663 start_codon:yes stop_codon:yes gene_type:complete
VSNYTQSTNFATKDALTSGDPLKIVKGTEINTEFVNIAVAVATKADLVSPTFTGTPTLPTGTIATTQTFGNSSTLVSTTAFVQEALQALHPVGSVYINATNATNPGTLLGFGTWTAFGAGRVPVGFNASNALFDTAEETGGSADSTLPSHTHSITDPGHAHSYTRPSSGPVAFGDSAQTNSTTDTTSTAVTGITVQSAGSSGTNTNYQPYITVYMWKRTA